MFAIGHIALGYILGKGTSKLTNTKLNLPLLLAASVLPDIDLLFRFLTHRGPTHSIITISILMIPFFIIYGKQALPYFAALLSHILIGDFITGGAKLFWPGSLNLFGALNFEVTSMPIASTELVLFLITLPLMYKWGDLKTLVSAHNNNWIIIIPFGAILGPFLLFGRGQENVIPTLLVIPSLFYLGLFAYSMFVWAKSLARVSRDKNNLRSRAQSSKEAFPFSITRFLFTRQTAKKRI